MNKNNSVNVLGFFKFGQKENLKKLQDGQFYCKNYKYYIEEEKKKNNKGKGDMDEVALLISNVNIELKKLCSEEKVFEAKADKVKIRNEEDIYKPLFCMNCLTKDDLIIKQEKEKQIKATFKFSDEDLESFKKDFGEWVLIISPIQFLDDLEKVFSEKKIKSECMKVKYQDNKINYEERVESFLNGSVSRYFYKNICFQNQKEFRIALDTNVEDHICFNIGSIKNYSKLWNISDLKGKEFEMFINIRD